MKGFSLKHIALKADIIGAENIVFCRHVHASFSTEILQAGAVKGLSRQYFQCQCDLILFRSAFCVRDLILVLSTAIILGLKSYLLQF